MHTLQEYDLGDTNLPMAERVAKQREQIKKRLGEQGCSMLVQLQSVVGNMGACNCDPSAVASSAAAEQTTSAVFMLDGRVNHCCSLVTLCCVVLWFLQALARVWTMCSTLRSL